MSVLEIPCFDLDSIYLSQQVPRWIPCSKQMPNCEQEASTWEYKADGLYSCKCGARIKPEDVYKSFYCYHCGAKKYVEDKTGMKHILAQCSGKIENVNARGITGWRLLQ